MFLQLWASNSNNSVKCLFLLLCFSLSFFESVTQSVRKGSLRLNTGLNFVEFDDRPFAFAAGMQAEYFVRQNLSFDYVFAANQDYVHFGLGTALAPLAAFYFRREEQFRRPRFRSGFSGKRYEVKDRNDPAGLLFLIASYESLGRHFYLSRVFEITPYYSLARIRYFRGESSDHGDVSWSISCSLGIRTNYILFKNLWFGTFAEGSRIYSPNKLWGLQAGFAFNYLFKARFRSRFSFYDFRF
jgi:hypothetical protein